MEKTYFAYPDLEHVYLLQEREFYTQGLPVYKIGQTRRSAAQRIKGYSKGTREILVMQVRNSLLVENILIESFKCMFIQRTDIGTETFEGDLYDMEKQFIDVVRQNRQTENGCIKAETLSKVCKNESITAMKKDDIAPLTVERIRDFIPLYTAEMVMKKDKGILEWILLLINTPEGPNFKCIDRDKPIFIRKNERGNWVKDGTRFMINIFKESSSEGKKLVDKVYEYRDEYMKSNFEREDLEKVWNEMTSFSNILKNEKTARSKFLKEILSDIAYDRYEIPSAFTSKGGTITTTVSMDLVYDDKVEIDYIYSIENKIALEDINRGLLNIIKDLL